MEADLEIICVGNELLIGKILNTNAQWLSKQATELGINVNRQTIIQDTIEEIAKTICEALNRKPQFIITTGGLGPTFDDKTLQGIAKALNRKLEVNQTALEMVRKKYEEYEKKKQTKTTTELTKPQVKMATLPQKTEPVNNPIGTAPGVRADVQGTILFALPGVPKEMEAIFQETISPLLKLASGNRIFCEKSLYADNIMESTLAPLIDITMNDNKGIYIKSHPLGKENKPHMEIHFTITAKVEEEPIKKLDKAAKQLSKLIQENGGTAITKQET